ncbi:MAG: hypothetical protein F9B45_13570 [Phycisphaera sp. RhM]|nr:hypothetical protein [Phycisphaera sp. RhM]
MGLRRQRFLAGRRNQTRTLHGRLRRHDLCLEFFQRDAGRCDPQQCRRRLAEICPVRIQDPRSRHAGAAVFGAGAESVGRTVPVKSDRSCGITDREGCPAGPVIESTTFDRQTGHLTGKQAASGKNR